MMPATSPQSHTNSTPPRPQPTAPQFENIPSELKVRRQWVCWRYEWDGKKWQKIPYTPGTTAKAKTNSARTWRSFGDAKAAYIERPDFFAGIGYVFCKDDPYCGIDHDRCVDPATGVIRADVQAMLDEHGSYSETSPSETGIKAIVTATLSGPGKKQGAIELYDQKRFFTITGRVVGNRRTIRAAQDAINVIYASLQSTKSKMQNGATTGSRADYAQQISEAWWTEARQRRRTVKQDEIGANGLPFGVREGTQSAFAARGDVRGLLARWPWMASFVTRGDGSDDQSMLRAILAEGLYRRAYSFPRFAAILTWYFGDYVRTTRGFSKDAWRQEVATLWFKNVAAFGPVERTPKPKPETTKRDVIYARKGRASDHAALAERVYVLLHDHRAGAQALVKIGALADAIGVHRRTIATCLDDLRRAGRITTTRQPGGAGLLVCFAEHERDVIYAEPARDVQPIATPQSEIAPPLHEETRENKTCVSSCAREADHISPAPADEPDAPAARPSLVQAVAEALESYPDVGRRRYKAVIAHAAMHGYTDADAVKRVYKAQTDPFSIERKRVSRLERPELESVIRAGQKRLTRNIGKRREGFWRAMLAIADDQRQRRGWPAVDILTAKPPKLPKPARRQKAAPAPAVPASAQLRLDDAPTVAPAPSETVLIARLFAQRGRHDEATEYLRRRAERGDVVAQHLTSSA